MELSPRSIRALGLLSLALGAGAVVSSFGSPQLFTALLLGSMGFSFAALLLHPEKTPKERPPRSVEYILTLSFLGLGSLLVLGEILALFASQGLLFLLDSRLVLLFSASVALTALTIPTALLLTLKEGEGPRKPRFTLVGVGAVAVGVFSLLLAFGVLEKAGINSIRPERAPFVVAVAVLLGMGEALLRLSLPGFSSLLRWVEEGIHERPLARRLLHTLALLSLSFLLLSLVLLVGGSEGGWGLALGLSLLSATSATFLLRPKPYVAQLDFETAQEEKKKRRTLLGFLSGVLLGLSALVGGAALGLLLEGLWGLGLLEEFLESTLGRALLLGVPLVVLLGVLELRLVLVSEVPYSEKRRGISIWLGVVSFLFVLLGTFLGSGIATGPAASRSNAIASLALSLVLGLLLGVVRGLLPLPRLPKKTPKEERELPDTIRRRMTMIYVGSLVLLLLLVSFVASTFREGPSAPSQPLGLLHLALIFLVAVGVIVLWVLQYVQSKSVSPPLQKGKPVFLRRKLTASELTKTLILSTSLSGAALLFLLGILIQVGAITNLGPFPVDPRFSTDLFVFALLAGVGPYGFFVNREEKRRRLIDQKFPEFLRDLAEGQRSGMTLTEAVVVASRGSYGALTPEIQKMAAQIEWGVSFEEALRRFSRRVRTPLIERTVELVIQASKSGGNVVDVLSAAADDAREIQMILKERRSSMSVYVVIIYIAFLVFSGVVAVLDFQFIPGVSRAVQGVSGVQLGGLTFKAFDVEEFRRLFFHAAVIQGFGGGLVAGVMESGKALSGLKHSFIMVVIAYVLFRFLLGA